MTRLGLARVVGELGLAGGTATSSAYAAKYSKEIVVVKQAKEEAEQKQKQAENEKGEAMRHRSDTSGIVYEVAKGYHALSEYVLSKEAELSTSLKAELAEVNSCLNDYLSDNHNKDCVKRQDKLKLRLKQLGFGWG